MLRFKKGLCFVLVGIMLLGLCACGNSASQSTSTASPAASQTASEATSEGAAEDLEPIKIGILLQLSGSSPQDSEELLTFCQYIADMINNENPDINMPLAAGVGLPNLGGRKVELVVGDAKTNDVAMSEAERLITQEGVVGMMGIIGSAGAKSAAVSFEKYGIPYVSNASSPTLTSSGYEYLIRIFPDDQVYVEATFKMLDYLNKEQNAGITTVALCSEDTEFGVNIAKIEAAAAEKYGFEVVENISYTATATNITSEVLRLKAADTDVVMMSSYTADAILFMRGFKEQNYFPKFLVGQRGGFSRNDMFTTLGDDMEYVFNTSPWAKDLDVPNAQLMCELFQKAMNDPNANLQEGVLRATTDFYTLCMAINQAGNTDADAIVAEYRNGIDIPEEQRWLPINNIKVDENGQGIEASTIIMQASNGEYRTVYPMELASAEIAYPAPSWNER